MFWNKTQNNESIKICNSDRVHNNFSYLTTKNTYFYYFIIIYLYIINKCFLKLISFIFFRVIFTIKCQSPRQINDHLLAEVTWMYVKTLYTNMSQKYNIPVYILKYISLDHQFISGSRQDVSPLCSLNGHTVISTSASQHNC